MTVATVLILGGTAEARGLAGELVAAGRPVLSSLAGRVSDPALPAGRVRIGGFGGVPGLAEFLARERIGAVVDATHPFALGISANAAAACSAAGVPLARLARPGWSHHPDADRWTWVDTHEAAAELLSERPGTPFLTTGRQTLDRYRPLAGREVLVRVVEPPVEPLPAGWLVIRDRGPYRVESELALMAEHTVSSVVTKDSGGSYTSAKLDAAALLGIEVLVIRRPPFPPEALTLSTPAAVLHWLAGLPCAGT